MRIASLFVVAGVAVAGLTSPLHASGTPSWVRSYVVNYASRAAATSSTPIPAFARKYNMNCSACHYPAAPRLNQTGIQFKWRGFRMPNEMGQSQDVGQVSNYLAVRGRTRYAFTKPSNASATQSSFLLNDATLFYGGAFGKNYYGWFEFEAEEGELGINTYVGGLWGKEKAFGGFRVGNFHVLKSGGIAGLDRPVGINQPMPLGRATTATVPFAYPAEELALEGFYVSGRNRLSAQVLNGVDPNGDPLAQDGDTKKDFAVVDQFLLDDKGSGFQAAGYYGNIVGLDPVVNPVLTTHYWRLVATANKIVSNFEGLAGVVYGKDQNLPVGTPSPGMGYWLSGQYMSPKSSLTLYGRYEFLDPNTDVASDGRRRIVAGSLIPVNLPEYLRFNVEYWLDLPQAAGSPKLHHVTGEVMLVF
jgi:hypothetical protein